MNNVTSFPTDRHVVSNRRDSPSDSSRIYLLGKTQAFDQRGKNILPKAKKTRAVFAYLCLCPGEAHARSHLAGMIWDRSGEAQALDTLRHALSELSRIAPASWRLERDRHTVRLDTANCWIDAFEIPDKGDRLLADLQGVSPSFDQWVHAERVRFESRWQTALERNLNEQIAQNAPALQRAATARELLNVFPTHETGVRSLMKAFVDMDEPAEAIREFERHRLLTETEGLPISRGTIALYEAIRIAAPTTNGRQPTLSSSINATQEASRGNARPQAKTDRPRENSIGGKPRTAVQPSIAVLPFRNLSGTMGQDYIIDGLIEDLVEALSRVPSFFVISRLSAATLGKQNRPPQEIGAALSVRYLLSGSVRIIDGRVRVVVELAEAETGGGLWRDHFDEKRSDLLELQSSLAEAVTRAVAPQLHYAELRRIALKRSEDYTAYDYLMRAQHQMHKASREVFESAEKWFDSAIAREPSYATALAWRAYWHVMRVGQGWSPDRRFDTQQAEAFARRAIECDPTEAMAFAVQGHAAAYLHRDFDRAFECFERALEINPNSPRAWLWSASADGWTCQGPRAIDKITRAMALSPYDPLMCAYTASASLAYLADGQYERSIEFAMRSIRENRSYTAAYKLLIVALVSAGNETDARGPANQLLMLEPGLTVAEFNRRFPGAGREIGKRCSEALAIAGIPLS